MVRHIGRFLGQLWCDALANLYRLLAANHHNVEFTAVGTYTGSIERESFWSKRQCFLRLQGKGDGSTLVVGCSSLCGLELLACHTAIAAKTC